MKRYLFPFLLFFNPLRFVFPSSKPNGSYYSHGCMLFVVTFTGGGIKVKICELLQYLNMYGVVIGYTIAASISMMALVKSSYCFNEMSGEKSSCGATSTKPYMVIFGVTQIILSQIPGFDLKPWLSIVGVVMSSIYSTIGLGLGIAKIAENQKLGGSLSGIPIGAAFTAYDKIWTAFRAFGDIAFVYSYSMILIKIQGTVGPSASEARPTMKRATAISAIATTTIYILHGVIGYAAFGDSAPKNILFEFSNPFWILKIANAAIVVHLIIAYQVKCKPLFEFTEKSIARRYTGPIIDILFRLVWRTIFVITTTIIPIFLPFDDMGGLLVALSFWPLTVHYPMEMYMNQNTILKWSRKWWELQILRLACLVITIVASVGYIAGFIYHVKANDTPMADPTATVSRPV